MKSNANQKSHINLDKCLEEMIGVHKYLKMISNTKSFVDIIMSKDLIRRLINLFLVYLI